MKKPAARVILSAVTNPLADKYLTYRLRVAGLALLLAAVPLACGTAATTQDRSEPRPTAALPVTNLAGQRVMVLPLTMALAHDSLPWRGDLSQRPAVLFRADSLLGALLTERAPAVTWVLPPELRRAAALSAGMVSDPGQFPTSMLRFDKVERLPDPLRSQIRNLAAVSGARYGLVPAALGWVPTDTSGAARAVVTGNGLGTAELVLVLVDARLGQVGFRTVARGAGDDPWTALVRAVRIATPEGP